MAKETKEELEALIVKETALIKALEGGENFENLTPIQHQTSIKDAYWRRRNWQSRLEGGPDFVQVFSTE